MIGYHSMRAYLPLPNTNTTAGRQVLSVRADRDPSYWTRVREWLRYPSTGGCIPHLCGMVGARRCNVLTIETVGDPVHCSLMVQYRYDTRKQTHSPIEGQIAFR